MGKIISISALNKSPGEAALTRGKVDDMRSGYERLENDRNALLNALTVAENLINHVHGAHCCSTARTLLCCC